MMVNFKEFIEKHVRVAPKGKHIELSPAQLAFLAFHKRLNDGKVTLLKPKEENKDE